MGATITFSHLVLAFSVDEELDEAVMQMCSPLLYPPAQLTHWLKHKSQTGLSAGHDTQVVLSKYGLSSGQFVTLEFTVLAK
jgi:hypothetical protein